MMCNNKKIVIDCRQLYESGIGRYLRMVLPTLTNHFSEVILLGNVNEILKFSSNFSNISVISFNAKKYSILEQLLLPIVVPKCDIFWTPMIYAPFLSINASKRIVTIHDVYLISKYSELGFLKKRIAFYFIKNALKKSDSVITVSNFSKNEINNYFGNQYSDKISVIYNSLPDEFINEKKTTVKSESFSYFLSIGNLKPHKNLYRSIHAFIKLKELFPEETKDIKYKIVGKNDGFITNDNSLKKFNETTLALNNIEFLGSVNESSLHYLYQNAGCLVFPSLYEGFGYPPLEAFLYGVPAIVSDIPCLREICNKAPLYFDPYDIESIFDSMRKVLFDKNVKSQLINDGYEVLKKFSDSQSAFKHAQLLTN